MICEQKHTAYQPTEEEWRCPWCSSDNAQFYIEEPAADAADDCGKLHAADELYCYKCERGLSGKAFASRLAKKKNVVTCPTCKGAGVVAEGKLR